MHRRPCQNMDAARNAITTYIICVYPEIPWYLSEWADGIVTNTYTGAMWYHTAYSPLHQWPVQNPLTSKCCEVHHTK